LSSASCAGEMRGVICGGPGFGAGASEAGGEAGGATGRGFGWTGVAAGVAAGALPGAELVEEVFAGAGFVPPADPDGAGGAGFELSAGSGAAGGAAWAVCRWQEIAPAQAIASSTIWTRFVLGSIASQRANGNSTRKVVPRPASDSKSIEPL